MNPTPDTHSSEGNETISSPSASRPESIQRDIETLRFYFTAFVLLMVLISGSINLFLRRQVRLVRAQASELNYVVSDYNKNRAPLMDDFVNRLREFSKTHADYAPIFARYIRPSETNVPTAPPASQPPR